MRNELGLLMTEDAYQSLLGNDLSLEALDDVFEQSFDMGLREYHELRSLGYKTFQEWDDEREFFENSPLFSKSGGSNRKSPVNITYAERKRVGKLGEQRVLEYLASREDTFALRDVSEDPAYFNGDVDIRWWTKTKGNLFTIDVGKKGSQGNLEKMTAATPWGREVKVEVKTSLRSLLRKSSYFIFQTVSNLETGLSGWAYRTEADRLIVWNLSTRMAYTFNVPPLQEYLRGLEKDVRGDGFLTGDFMQRDGNRVISRNRCLLVSKRLIDQLDKEKFDHVQFKLE